MVAQQEATIIADERKQPQLQENSPAVKGKRTKRTRPPSPSPHLALTMSTTTTATATATATSYTAAEEAPRGSSPSEINSATSAEWAPKNRGTDPEDEDMAHCLILLAQGSYSPQLAIKPSSIKDNNNNNFKKANNNNDDNNSSRISNVVNGANSYECKTCNRSFLSFQALGGHRASHKKPKIAEKPSLSLSPSLSPVNFSLTTDNHQQQHNPLDEEAVALSLRITNHSSSYNITSNNNNNSNNNIVTVSKVKVHECGICGAHFSSGQALGGHMRRHRPIGTTSIPSPSRIVVETEEVKMQNNSLLSLDLNLPAPEDDPRDSKFVFGSTEKTLVFSATSLVDCHY